MNMSLIKGAKSTQWERASASRSIAQVLAPLEQLAKTSPSLITNHGARFENQGLTYELPRYMHIGPKGGGEMLRVGIFAGLHGDEPEGVQALVKFLTMLEREPQWAAGYCLFLYPICNPTGFEDRTRHSRSGKDLNREFWRDASAPEVRLLQSELVAHCFHGVIALHSDKTSRRFYGVAGGATLTKDLLEPALKAAEEFLPIDGGDFIEGFEAREAMIHQSDAGVLSGPPKVRPRPFEITLKTPQFPPAYLKEAALEAALQAILSEYRRFLAYAPNL
jgi:hypothetical protein